MNYEWGPWIEHDGKGCPVVGQLVHVELQHRGQNPDGTFSSERIVVAEGGRSWFANSLYNPIIRYRVRKPRIAEWLQEQTQDLPVPSPEKVDA